MSAGETIQVKPPEPKILFYDIEMSQIKAVVYTHDLKQYSNYISHKCIEEAKHVICIGWQFNNGPVLSVSARYDPAKKYGCDKFTLEVFSHVYNQADFVVTHNGDAFDFKWLQGRMAYHGLPPLPIKPSIDTLKIARKMGFESRSLGYLARHLGLEEQKGKAPDWDMYRDDMAGTLPEIERYCRLDVKTTRELYYKLRPYHDKHPHMGGPIEYNKHVCCPKCLSHNFVKNGVRVTAGAKTKQQRYRCNDCGGWFSDIKSVRMGNLTQ